MTQKFFLVLILTAAINTGAGLIIPILPLFLKDFGFNTIGLSLPFVALVLGRLLSRTYAASIMHRFTDKKTIIGCFVLYMIVFLIYPLIHSPILFVSIRFFEGVVEGIGMVCVIDMAVALSSQNRGKLMGYFNSSIGLGFILGPAIGSLVYGSFGGTAMFLSGAAVAFVGVICSLMLPNTIPLVNIEKKKSRIFASLKEYSNLVKYYLPSIIRRVLFFSFMLALPLY